MYLSLFLVAVLYLYVVKEEKNLLLKYGILGGILVLFPLTGGLVNRYFQGFYQTSFLQWLLPVMGTIAYAVVDIYGKQWEKRCKLFLLPVIGLVILLSGFLSRDYLPEEKTVDAKEVETVLELLLADEEGRQISVVAPQEIMECVRTYDGRILVPYGRDIWEQNLDYAFYGNYEEWAYGLAEHMEEPFEENEELILPELEQSGVTHVIFDKENLFFGEDMQYPAKLSHGGMVLSRMDETRHYVIYERTE